MIEVDRIRKAYEKLGKRFLDGVYTGMEQEFSLKHADPSERLAARWAAKEAVLKALGTGYSRGVKWTEVEIIDNELSRPTIRVSGRVAEFMGEMRTHISISHLKDYATAIAVIEE